MVLVDNLRCLRNNIENLWQSEKRKTILALVFCCTNKSLVIQKEEFWNTCVSRIWGAIEDILLVYSITDHLYREKIRNKKLYLEKACYILTVVYLLTLWLEYRLIAYEVGTEGSGNIWLESTVITWWWAERQELPQYHHSLFSVLMARLLMPPGRKSYITHNSCHMEKLLLLLLWLPWTTETLNPNIYYLCDPHTYKTTSTWLFLMEH